MSDPLAARAQDVLGAEDRLDELLFSLSPAAVVVGGARAPPRRVG